MNIRIFLTISVAGMLITGCDRKAPVADRGPVVPPIDQPVARTETFETHALRKAIDAYELEPTPVHAARVKKAFAEIDGEIAELVEHVAKKDGAGQAEAARKLANLRTYRDGEQARFLRIEALAAVPNPNNPPVPIVPREGTAEKIGEAIDEAARKLDEKARETADKLREKVR